MSIIRKLKHRAKPILAGLALVAVSVATVWYLTADDAAALSGTVNTQTWIDVDGNVYERKLIAFDDAPAVGPTGKPAFRAELCFWTRDGKTKQSPTPVLLNSHVGKPEPTFCPDCGRLVTPLNPSPPAELQEGQVLQAPPSESELKARK